MMMMMKMKRENNKNNQLIGEITDDCVCASDMLFTVLLAINHLHHIEF